MKRQKSLVDEIIALAKTVGVELTMQDAREIQKVISMRQKIQKIFRTESEEVYLFI